MAAPWSHDCVRNRGIISLLTILLIFAASCLASPLLVSSSNITDADFLTSRLNMHDDHTSSLMARQTASNFYLRIMPLGASITRGSNDHPDLRGRGYRKFLRDKLRILGWKVNMVGSFRNGEQFADNDTEGYPGFVIGPEDGSAGPDNNSVHNRARTSLPKYKPNLVLVNCGTNDAAYDNDIGNAGKRMEAMLRFVYDSSPGVVVILSTLLPHGKNDDRVIIINQQLREVVYKLQHENFKIELAEMHDGFIPISEIWDGTHPTYEGAKRMAASWELAIKAVIRRGNWLVEPSTDVDFKDDQPSGGSQTCDKEKNSGLNDPRSGMQILYALSGNIKDDGTYVHSSQEHRRIMSFDRPKKPWERRAQVYAVQLWNWKSARRGGERDDLVYIDGEASTAEAILNTGTFRNQNTYPLDKINIPTYCITRGIRWGDVNNDGLDDFICISPNGDMLVSINLGTPYGTSGPLFRDVGVWKTGIPEYPQANVRLGDIDGDGRLDYCVVGSNGDMRCWRSGGIQKDKADFWQDLGVVWSVQGKDLGTFDIAEMRLVDINGDFRTDCLWVDMTGRVRTWINQRDVGKNLVPYWKPAGVTHPGMGRDIGIRENVFFGRLYNDNHMDYMFWDAEESDNNNDGIPFSYLHAWEQKGSGGTYQKGDGSRFADMTGNGVDDYVWVNKNGDIVVFVNRNTPPAANYEGGSAWDDKGVVFATGQDPRAIHLGDWDGDGKADVIIIDRETGTPRVYLTKYENGQFGAYNGGEGLPLSDWCTQGWGVGFRDSGVQLEDLTGDGCVDYICIEPDGRSLAYLNDCSKQSSASLWNQRFVGQIKKAETPLKDRANIRFADVNGDGRADYMWVDKFNGDTTVWYNTGELPESQREGNSGSIFGWSGKGVLYAGSSRGLNMLFPNLGGVGRADMVHVDPKNGHGWIWFNTCPAGGNGDDGGVVPRDPELPFYTPELQCPAPICFNLAEAGSDISWGCGMDPIADDFSNEDLCESIFEHDPEDDGPLPDKRDVSLNRTDLMLGDDSAHLQFFEKRGKKRSFDVTWQILGIAWQITVQSRGFPGSTHLGDSTRGPPAVDLAFAPEPSCNSAKVKISKAISISDAEKKARWDSEHNPDLQFLADFIWSAVTGNLPNGTTVATLNSATMTNNWNANVLPSGLKRRGTSRCIKTPNSHVFDRFGSHGNRAPFVWAERDMNQLKGRLFNFRRDENGFGRTNPIAPTQFEALLDASVYSPSSQAAMFDALRQIVVVFNYINHPQLRNTLHANILSIQEALGDIENSVNGFNGLVRIYRDFYPAWYQQAVDLARTWLTERLQEIEARFAREEAAGNAPLNLSGVRALVQELYDLLETDIISPFRNGPI